jgi:RimJ/RimL family protein N-acetyltransferase
MPLTKFESNFAESGYWSLDEGIFAIVDPTDRLVGIVGWEKLNGDLPDIEVFYRLLDQADRGKGIATEGLGLLAGWVFDTGHMNRIRANVHVDNNASRRVAEKSGFTQERRPGRAGTTADGGMTSPCTRSPPDEFEERRKPSATPA